jgi:hypothetical protein
MNETQYLLDVLAEEAAEVAHRASKSIRFGSFEVQPGQELNNSARLSLEIRDFTALVKMLMDRGLVDPEIIFSAELGEAKEAKVMAMMAYSRKLGQLE